jgi:uncharacterized OB-fold protein
MSTVIQDYPGTSLHEADIASGKVLTVPDATRPAYDWDLGAAMGRYLAELKNGRLVGTVCRDCQRVLFPPRLFCEQCFRPVTEWVELRDTGVIQTFAICHIAWDATRISEPKLPAVIAIDGASPLMGLLHLIGGTSPDEVRVGQRVRAVWKPPEEREGRITDILYFTPAEA